MSDIRVVEADENGSPRVIEVLVGDTWVRQQVVPETTDKACRNCGKLWPPEYGGQCDHCGAPMNTVGPTPSLVSGGDVNSHLAGLRRTVSTGGSFAQRMANGNAAQADSGHPGVNHIKQTADPYAQEVLNDILN